MTVEEAKKAVEELKAQGTSEEDILGSFYLMFQEDEIDVNQLGDLVGVLGYELTEDFKNMSPEDQKTKGFEETEDAEEGVSEEEVEEAKEAGDEDKEDGEDKEEEENDEDKAKRLFGFDK